MSTIQRIALVLTIIGAINWGLIGFFNLIWSQLFLEVQDPPSPGRFTRLWVL